MGSSLGNHDTYGPGDLVRAVAAARDAMVVLGQAAPGDKTILDAVFPFVATLEEETGQNKEVAEALGTAAAAATWAAAATAPLRPRKGKSAPLGGPERRDA